MTELNEKNLLIACATWPMKSMLESRKEKAMSGQTLSVTAAPSWKTSLLRRLYPPVLQIDDEGAEEGGRSCPERSSGGRGEGRGGRVRAGRLVIGRDLLHHEPTEQVPMRP